jgi:hypothetical protein
MLKSSVENKAMLIDNVENDVFKCGMIWWVVWLYWRENPGKNFKKCIFSNNGSNCFFRRF